MEGSGGRGGGALGIRPVTKKSHNIPKKKRWTDQNGMHATWERGLKAKRSKRKGMLRMRRDWVNNGFGELWKDCMLRRGSKDVPVKEYNNCRPSIRKYLHEERTRNQREKQGKNLQEKWLRFCVRSSMGGKILKSKGKKTECEEGGVFEQRR